MTLVDLALLWGATRNYGQDHPCKKVKKYQCSNDLDTSRLDGWCAGWKKRTHKKDLKDGIVYCDGNNTTDPPDYDCHIEETDDTLQKCKILSLFAWLHVVMVVAAWGAFVYFSVEVLSYKAAQATVTNNPDCVEDDITCDRTQGEGEEDNCTPSNAWDCDLMLEFKLPDGTTIHASHDTTQQLTQSNKGDKISIWYKKKNPQDIKTTNPMLWWGVCLGVALLLTCLTWCIYVKWLQAFKPMSKACCKHRLLELLMFRLFMDN